MQEMINNKNKLPSNVKITVQTSKRTKLIRWMYEVLIDFEYHPCTYILAVVMLDNYMKDNKLVELQLLGITCLCIAAKIEETYIKKIEDYCEVTDFTYTASEIIDMERNILEKFGYNMNFVLPYCYIDYIGHADISGSDYVYLLMVCVCVRLEKEEGNMYYAMVSASNMCKELLGNQLTKEIKFYIDRNERVNNILNKAKQK